MNRELTETTSLSSVVRPFPRALRFALDLSMVALLVASADAMPSVLTTAARLFLSI